MTTASDIIVSHIKANTATIARLTTEASELEEELTFKRARIQELTAETEELSASLPLLSGEPTISLDAVVVRSVRFGSTPPPNPKKGDVWITDASQPKEH